MSLDAAQFATDMLAAYETANKLGGMDTASKATLKTDWEFQYDLLFAHIVANMAISGIQVSDPAETVETYVAGTGSNGGTLTGQIPIVGTVKQAAKTRTQSNDGTGRVS